MAQKHKVEVASHGPTVLGLQGATPVITEGLHHHILETVSSRGRCVKG